VITSKKGGASAASDILLPGKAGGTVAVRRTLASTICCIADPTQVPRPRQLRDASTVMRFQPAHQSMINRRFDDRAPCLAWMSPKQVLAGKPRIHSPASGNGGHESGSFSHEFKNELYRAVFLPIRMHPNWSKWLIFGSFNYRMVLSVDQKA